MDDSGNQHVRRQRYKGTHPKHFDQKYKELNPEKYGDTIQKVLQKGSTPAGMHRSICVDEILDFLDLQPGQVGVDCTLGYGGHTLEMLKKLNGTGHVFGLDVDPIESVKTKDRLQEFGYGEERFTLIVTNFQEIGAIAKERGPFDFILADLGVSSMQIDNPHRGFSYKLDGPLDLRMNPQKGEPASNRLFEMTMDEIEGMLLENADETYAHEIAEAISKEQRKGIKIDTTTKLRELIQQTLSFLPEQTKKEEIKKACQRSFQAMRIDVNHELDSLFLFLDQIPECLKPGGKVAILTFHSGEDRLVKKAFKHFHQLGVYEMISPAPIRPSAEECHANPRATSAKLRFAIKKQS
ncbi:MAG: 16S rRNA (cytosine(1402)-N(4))-methyltransferase RsmH [Candidatus Izemoplasmatales bacterium]|nr:16S rRNA (cytosine(1402)-N(4))-methyltransferase RsmH [Candidatus Izemoplasmatales bacterium]